jgi:thiamine-phosphate pyrophosphorylase
LYYITDRTQFPGNGASRRERLLEQIAQASRAGIDYIQLREKDLPARELESLAREAVRRVKESGLQPGASRTLILINSRSDIALAAGADGVHLRAGDIAAGDARNLFAQAGVERPLIAVSCHSPEEVRLAESQGADFVVMGPVFESDVVPGKARRSTERDSKAGLDRLRQACASRLAAAERTPVLALGGVTLHNFSQCLAAGAAGVAGIRLFQENDLSALVPTFRESAGVRNKTTVKNRRHPYLPD